MPSWVRYSVAVYVGLLLAGSVVLPPSATVGSESALHPAPPATVRSVSPDRPGSDQPTADRPTADRPTADRTVADRTAAEPRTAGPAPAREAAPASDSNSTPQGEPR